MIYVSFDARTDFQKLGALIRKHCVGVEPYVPAESRVPRTEASRGRSSSSQSSLVTVVTANTSATQRRLSLPPGKLPEVRSTERVAVVMVEVLFATSVTEFASSWTDSPLETELF